MGVALENARLFDETKRLLAETDQRAAELAVINSVQQGLAAELDMQAMYDLVGDKIREIFDAQVVDIGHLRPSTHGLIHFPLHDRARRPLLRRAAARPISGSGAHRARRRRAVVVDDDRQGWLPSAGFDGPPVGEPASPSCFAPLIVGGDVVWQHLAPEHRSRARLHGCATSAFSRPSPRA